MRIVLRLVELKVGPPSEAVRGRIGQADKETLLQWSEQILTATDIEAVSR